MSVSYVPSGNTFGEFGDGCVLQQGQTLSCDRVVIDLGERTFRASGESGGCGAGSGTIMTVDDDLQLVAGSSIGVRSSHSG